MEIVVPIVLVIYLAAIVALAVKIDNVKVITSAQNFRLDSAIQALKDTHDVLDSLPPSLPQLGPAQVEELERRLRHEVENLIHHQTEVFTSQGEVLAQDLKEAQADGIRDVQRRVGEQARGLEERMGKIETALEIQDDRLEGLLDDFSSFRTGSIAKWGHHATRIDGALEIAEALGKVQERHRWDIEALLGDVENIGEDTAKAIARTEDLKKELDRVGLAVGKLMDIAHTHEFEQVLPEQELAATAVPLEGELEQVLLGYIPPVEDRPEGGVQPVMPSRTEIYTQPVYASPGPGLVLLGHRAENSTRAIITTHTPRREFTTPVYTTADKE